MSTGIILKSSFILSIGITIFGAIQKIMRADGADWLLMAGLIATAIFVITALYEVNTSGRIARSEKVMWTIGLLFLSGIAGLVYLLSGRRRIVNTAS